MKKKYSKEEKLSFKHGMQAQFSKEHPIMNYQLIYNQQSIKNGLKFGDVVSYPQKLYKTKQDANKAKLELNKRADGLNKIFISASKSNKLDDTQSNIIDTFNVVKVRKRNGIDD